MSDASCLIALPDNPSQYQGRILPCHMDIRSNCTKFCNVEITFSKFHLQKCSQNVTYVAGHCDRIDRYVSETVVSGCSLLCCDLSLRLHTNRKWPYFAAVNMFSCKRRASTPTETSIASSRILMAIWRHRRIDHVRTVSCYTSATGVKRSVDVTYNWYIELLVRSFIW